MIDLRELDFRKKIKRITRERNLALMKIEELKAEIEKLKRKKK